MRILRCTALLLLATALPAFAQRSQSAAVGAHLQTYRFSEGLGAESATLLLSPIAYVQPLGRRASMDVYAAYARGTVESRGRSFELNGVVDTRVRASYSVSPRAVLTVGLNLPTGDPTHDTGEAIVAGLMSTTLLGFREASWGSGFGATTGFAVARQVAGWGVGLGGSYRYASEFEPRPDTVLSFSPGDETRLRLALDRTFGSSGTLTAGFTFQRFSADQIRGRDLFQSGNRLRGDVAYSFRTGQSATWTAYVADVWRERGDLTLDLVDDAGAVVGDTTFATGSQNLVVAGLSGDVRLGPELSIRPSLDFAVQGREEPGGEGWLLGGGAEVPLRLFGRQDVLPRLRLTYGRLEDETETLRGFWGVELGTTVQWSPSR